MSERASERARERERERERESFQTNLVNKPRLCDNADVCQNEIHIISTVLLLLNDIAVSFSMLFSASCVHIVSAIRYVGDIDSVYIPAVLNTCARCFFHDFMPCQLHAIVISYTGE